MNRKQTSPERRPISLNRLNYVCAAVFVAAAVLFGVYVKGNQTEDNKEAPVISVEGDRIEVSVKDDEDVLLKGITAQDAEDGDITDSVVVEGIGLFEEDGSRTVTYAVVDSDNNVVHASRKLIYTDYTAPRIYMSKPLLFETNTTNLVSGVTANDCLDGDITSSVRLLSETGINVQLTGSYEAALTVSNSAGDTTTIPVTVDIYDSSERGSTPVIQLNDYIAYIDRGAKFDAGSYLKSVTINGKEYIVTEEEGTYSHDMTKEPVGANTMNYKYIGISSDVRTETPGCYEVKYTFSDSDGETGTVRLYVVVTERGAE